METVRDCELVVIGAGPGGYAAAFRAADLGFRVTLVDAEPRPGGVCLLRGCIPSKALIQIARHLEEIPSLATMGIEVASPASVNLVKAQEWKNSLVERMSRGIKELARARRVELVRGTARFVAENKIILTNESGQVEQCLRFARAVVATGSRPTFPPGLTPDGEAIVTSDYVLDLRSVPQRCLVIGGGYIGLELGRCLAAFGSEVTVVEVLESVLATIDPELVRPVVRKLASRGVEVLTNHRVDELVREGAMVRATVLNQKDGKAVTKLVDLVVVATGRAPATEGLGLEAARISADRQGAIVTTATGRTSNPHVYAVGDCRGGIMLAHKARHEGLVVAEVLAGLNRRLDDSHVPQVVFTDPEIACVGLTEAEARKRGLSDRDYDVYRFPFAAVGRAAISGQAEGLVKVLVERCSRRLLGVGIVGPEAGELIAEATVALQSGLTVDDLREAIHPHPTLSEAVEEAAWLAVGGAVHLYKPVRTQPRRKRR